MKPPKKPALKGWIALTLAAGLGAGLGAGAGLDVRHLRQSFDTAAQAPSASITQPAPPAFVQDPAVAARPSSPPAAGLALTGDNAKLLPPMPDGILNAINNDDVFALHSALNNSRWKLHDNDDAIMRIAAATRAWNIVSNALELGAAVHARNDAALREAARAGDSGIVQQLVDRGADVHALDEYPLRIASAYGHDDIVLYLLEHGAKPDANMINLASFSATADPAMREKSQAVIRHLKSALPRPGQG